MRTSFVALLDANSHDPERQMKKHKCMINGCEAQWRFFQPLQVYEKTNNGTQIRTASALLCEAHGKTVGLQANATHSIDGDVLYPTDQDNLAETASNKAAT